MDGEPLRGVGQLKQRLSDDRKTVILTVVTPTTEIDLHLAAHDVRALVQAMIAASFKLEVQRG